MSSSLGAGQWIVDSQDLESILEPVIVGTTNEVKTPRKADNRAYQLVADIRQRLLDGYYDNKSKVYVDTIHMRQHNEIKHGKIVGISLGDNLLKIEDKGMAQNREMIEKNFHGLPGKIHILLQKINQEVDSIYIGDIANISSSVTNIGLPKIPGVKDPHTPIQVETSAS